MQNSYDISKIFLHALHGFFCQKLWVLEDLAAADIPLITYAIPFEMPMLSKKCFQKMLSKNAF